MSGTDTTFGLQPIWQQGMPSVPPASSPQFIQFQFNGVNLGGPDADTVNFVGAGITVTRGGADGNTITVTLA